jgi:hypothetical protein
MPKSKRPYLLTRLKIRGAIEFEPSATAGEKLRLEHELATMQQIIDEESFLGVKVPRELIRPTSPEESSEVAENGSMLKQQITSFNEKKKYLRVVSRYQISSVASVRESSRRLRGLVDSGEQLIARLYGEVGLDLNFRLRTRPQKVAPNVEAAKAEIFQVLRNEFGIQPGDDFIQKLFNGEDPKKQAEIGVKLGKLILGDNAVANNIALALSDIISRTSEQFEQGQYVYRVSRAPVGVYYTDKEVQASSNPRVAASVMSGRIAVGDLVFEPGFMSTSLDPSSVLFRYAAERKVKNLIPTLKRKYCSSYTTMEKFPP